MTRNECCICTSTFSSKLRKPIECVFCNKSCCKECFETFTKTRTVPACMFCNSELTMDFVQENSSIKFMGEYMRYLDDNHFSVERSKLPATQNLVEIVRKYDDSLKKYLQNKKERKDLAIQGRNIKYNDELDKIQKRALLKPILLEIQKKNRESYNHANVLHKFDREKRIEFDILSGRRDNTLTLDDQVVEEKPVYTRPCPSEGCRGFLSSAYKCGTCENYYCSDCHLQKNSRTDNEHVCDEDAKATIAMIRRDTKPCPKCMIGIEKVSGCSQMWCVNCHTTFDWNTMKIETGYIHNPEYLRWMRDNNNTIPRNPLDPGFVCNNDMPDWYEVDYTLKTAGIYSLEWAEIFRRYGHLKYFVLMNLPIREEYRVINMRVDYMQNKISIDGWRKKLGSMLKRNRLAQDRYNIIDMYVNVIKDLFLNLLHSKDINQFKKSSEEIEKHANEQLKKINKKYKSFDNKYLEIRRM